MISLYFINLLKNNKIALGNVCGVARSSEQNKFTKQSVRHCRSQPQHTTQKIRNK